MFSVFARKAPATAFINGTAVAVEPKETLLHAALRAGIDFPNSCRVGSCATCRCRLVRGKVRELTRASYALSAEELAQGYILACQSVPVVDVEVEVEVKPAVAAPRRVGGRVTRQTKLTHDIVELSVRLDESLTYRAGQFADIALAGAPAVRRSYSFATPPRLHDQVRFFVRRMPGGAFSALVNDRDLTGAAMTVEGPKGDFYLRPAATPLLFVAGGSGLAPILAMLEEAAAAGVKRPATLLFGVRTRRDLYALAGIERIAGDWGAAFEFVPVLSEADEDGGWQGERGLVTTLIPRALCDGAHAYLCGPPGMVDDAVAVLSLHRVPSDRIHADRFVASGGAAQPGGPTES